MDDAPRVVAEPAHRRDKAIKITKTEKPPSGAAHGAVMTILLWIGFGWLLAYTVLDIPFLEAIGTWNYALLLGLVVVLAVHMRLWRADMRRFVSKI